jgi:hypothetical protein
MGRKIADELEHPIQFIRSGYYIQQQQQAHIEHSLKSKLEGTQLNGCLSLYFQCSFITKSKNIIH